MKLLKFTLLITTVTSLLLSGSCHKIDPNPAQFYFKCNVNGQEYIPNGCANCVQCDLIGDTTLILGGNRGFETLGVSIQDNDGITPRQQLLNDLDLQNKGGGGLYKNSTITNDIYRTDKIRIGRLIIESIDKQNRIIKGSFYFKAYNTYRNDSVNVTDGQFRLIYHL